MRYGYSGIPIVIGRILLALIFVLAGLEKVFNWNAELGFLSSTGMPASGFFLAVALVIELVAGVMLLFGLKTRLAASVLFLYLIPVTLVMHSFWNTTSPAIQSDNIIHFFKNVSIMGGLLAVVGYESLFRRSRKILETSSDNNAKSSGDVKAA